jgi:hypothetical protein
MNTFTSQNSSGFRENSLEGNSFADAQYMPNLDTRQQVCSTNEAFISTHGGDPVVESPTTTAQGPFEEWNLNEEQAKNKQNSNEENDTQVN